MENPILGGCQDAPTTYDYRMYDRIWKRVSPDLDPYPEIRAASENAAVSSQPTETPMQASPSAAMPAPSTAMPAPGAAMPTPSATVSVPPANNNEANLPGAEENPCCMGTAAQESLDVVEGFLAEELAERRWCLSLCRRVRSQPVVRLLRRVASEKQSAARELCAAYFLITGACYSPAIPVEHTHWDGLADAMRFCYHQETCNSFNYERAADGTTDPCLQKLFQRLGEQSRKRAEDIMSLLGQMVCQGMTT